MSGSGAPIANFIFIRLLRVTSSIYKIPDGKPENAFAFSGEAKNKRYATEIVHECHEAWRRLIVGESSPGDISIKNLSVQNSPGFVSRNDPAYTSVPADSRKPPAPIDPSSECLQIRDHRIL
jgi:inorganic pyrophosphatase